MLHKHKISDISDMIWYDMIWYLCTVQIYHVNNKYTVQRYHVKNKYRGRQPGVNYLHINIYLNSYGEKQSLAEKISKGYTFFNSCLPISVFHYANINALFIHFYLNNKVSQLNQEYCTDMKFNFRFTFAISVSSNRHFHIQNYLQ
jgi:hypothetical protein